MQSLKLPLKGEVNRPIYDAQGKLVSISQNAPLFVAAVNLAHELAQCDDGIVPAVWRDRAKEIVSRE